MSEPKLPHGDSDSTAEGGNKLPAPSDATLPDQIRQHAAVLAEGLGITPPPEAGTKIPIDMTLPLQTLGRELGLLGRGSELFRQGEVFVTVDSRSGEIRPITAARLCSWIESVAWPMRVTQQKSTGEWIPRYSRVTKNLAQLILETDEFRQQARELRGVKLVRLPVWREPGDTRSIELLPAGYDSATGFYTADTLPFDPDLDPNEAHRWLNEEILAHYPWANEWSKAVHFAAMLSPFVQLLLPLGSKRLMVVYNANQPGTGKSTLARMALFPVLGEVPAQSVDHNPDELRKILDTCVFERKEVLFLDDLGNLRSRELNSFVTSGRWRARVLGKSQTMDAPVDAQIFVTGNQLDVGRDLARRAAVCELFLSSDPLARRFPLEITDEWLLLPETRAKFLAVLWAAIRHWCDSGSPRDPQAHRPSFEAFTSLVGSIVSTFKMGTPFAAITLAADEEGDAIKDLLAAAAAQVDTGTTRHFRNGELRDLADSDGLAVLDLILPYKTPDPAKALGQRLKKGGWIGRDDLRDTRGRRFEFGRRRGNRGAIYPVTVFED